MLGRTRFYMGLVVASLLFIFLAGGTVLAQAPVTGQHMDDNWQATYWNNMTFAGSAVLQRAEGSLDHSWGVGAPDPSVSADRFSARWTRYIDVSPGAYRFTAVSDDGIRVWVDGELIINLWNDHPATTSTAQMNMGVGHHLVQVDYYENIGDAVARLTWEPASTSINNWRGEYYNNTVLSGAPVLVRDDANVDYNWGNSAPAPGVVNADNFSVRWTRQIEMAANTYRFTATSDDGIRMWVDGEQILNAWNDHAAQTISNNKSLSAGTHQVIVEYYEHAGDAVARLTWEPVAAATGWRGEYYNNMTLSGSPALVRYDADINFNWGAGSPAPGFVGADSFSVRWSRTVNLPAGNYRFTVTTDDGARLWVNDHELIDAWKDQAATTYTGDIYLPGGDVPIKLEYYENGQFAIAMLSWSISGGPPQGSIIVDDTSPGFVKGGSPTAWHGENEGYGNHLTWTQNNDLARPDYNWARWYPNLRSGRYEVFVYIPNRFSTTSQAYYWVAHRNGYTLRVVDQSKNSGQWVSLGTYNFQGTRTDYVSLSDVTNEPYLSHLVAFDAIKWEAR
ncbi:MAG: hypothetical protein EXR62_05155 [Chloroflexi bacterium]|nr:hypothetical protein [Chloroflexota bacterium]